MMGVEVAQRRCAPAARLASCGGKCLAVALIAAVSAIAWGQSGPKEPHIGYVYPAGGCKGTVSQVWVGGQSLRGCNAVYVSGEGVHASVVEFVPPLRPLDKDQRDELARRMKVARDARLAELKSAGVGTPPARTEAAPVAAGESKKVELPNHPMLRDIENMSLNELQNLTNEIANYRKKQMNMQIAESVVIEVTVDAGALPGDRELRLKTPAGLSNPLRFQVGMFPELSEEEPNDPYAKALPLPEAPIELPVLLNGQIKPGDVDRFRFRATQGQHLVIQVQARHLIPYLADAVPGWFQSTITLYDSAGKEIAAADDYQFNPDPVLHLEVPKTGDYTLEIHDAVFRGREDFVYRIAIGEQPFVTRIFPLGGPGNVETTASIDGWNLPVPRITLDTRPEGASIRETALTTESACSNAIPYAVGALPECAESEPNSEARSAQPVALPCIVNGRIVRPGDVDVFQFEGKAGDELVAEAMARRLSSPLDSLLRLTDTSGKVLEWNDDHEDRESGMLTHHADSYLRATLPGDGTYQLHIADSQGHGGNGYAYRLRIGSPQPDFALRVTPSSINLRPGRATPICVYALRKDGFEGAIDVRVKDTLAGLTLDGGRIPSGCEQIRMTLTVPSDAAIQPLELHLEGVASIGGQTVVRPVLPAEDMMQAFLYRHLTPSQQLLASAEKSKYRVPPVRLVSGETVRIAPGGSAEIQVLTPKSPLLAGVQLELRDPPAGVSLDAVAPTQGGLAFSVRADASAAKVGLADNLIVEAFGAPPAESKGGKGPSAKRRPSLGYLPAIPIEIVQQ
ncbi:MAG: PPC domain-containing protein [Candidatus Hydrogenedentes bacterium]|nr:PPC domain-containing protein [Candidatus Hydrogenedentota bacterium]